MKLARNALTSACLVMVAAPVFADVYGSATLGAVSFRLIDLAPNDGIAPSISFLHDTEKFSGGADVQGTAQMGQPNGSEAGNVDETFDKNGAWSQTNVSGSVHTALSTAAASVTGTATGVGFTGASVSGSVRSSAAQSAYSYAEASAPSFYSHPLVFTLSPNTEVVFSVNVSMDVHADMNGVTSGVSDESIAAVTSVYAAGPGSNLHLAQDDEERKVSLAWTQGSALSADDASWSGVISASYSNIGNRSHEGNFGVLTDIEAISSAVPEPSAYGMLLGGLGLIGGLLRRRGRGARAVQPANQ